MILDFDDAGTGPLVVLLHSRPADRTQWKAVARILIAAGHRVLAPDFSGFGTSRIDPDQPAAPWQDLRDTLDSVGASRVTLVGNSLGAQTALQYAASWPGDVAGMVLMGYRRHDQTPGPGLQAAWDAEQHALAADDLDRAVHAGTTAWLSPAATETTRTVLARALRNDIERRADPQPRAAAPDPLDDPEWASRVQGPVRILHGADDLVDFAIGVERLRNLLGAPEIEIVADSGHLIPLEQPATVAAAVLEMLYDLDAEWPLRATNGRGAAATWQQ